MPTPKKNESKDDFLNRCTKELVDKEDRNPDQAYAMCNSYWKQDKKACASVNLTAPVELEAKESDEGERPKKFYLTAYTGKPIDRMWGQLVLDVSGIHTRNKIPILREHHRDRVVGYSTKTWKDDGNLLVGGKFVQASTDSKEVVDYMLEGYPWQASVGVWPIEIEVLESEKHKTEVNGYEIAGPADIWRKSEVREVSFVSLGADDDTVGISFGAEAENVRYYRTENKKGDTVMTLEELKEQHPDVYEEALAAGRSSVETEELEQAAVEQGREYVLGLVQAQYGDDAEERLRSLVSTGITVDQYKAVVAGMPEKQEGKNDDTVRQMLDAIQASGADNPGADSGADKGDKNFWEEVERLIQTEGMARGSAIRKVAKEQPELHETWRAGLSSVK